MLTSAVISPDAPADDIIITLAKAKKQLRIEQEFTDEDDLIRGYIEAAIAAAENYCGAHLYAKTMTLEYSGFQNPFILEAYPVKSVDSVKYFQADNEDIQTIEAADFYITKQNIKVVKLYVKNQPNDVDTDRPDAIEVVLTVGFADGKVPTPIQQAILLMISDMYERREDRPKANITVAHGLMRPYRKYT